MDVSVQAQVLELLKKLCRERNASVMLITHDMGVIAETTDRVAVLYAGRLVEIGNTASLLSSPRHPYTRGLIASTPSVEHGDISTHLYQIDGSMPRLDALPTGCSFHPRCQGVRQAMNIAINRDAIKQVVMREQSDPTGVIMPPFVNGWTTALTRSSSQPQSGRC